MRWPVLFVALLVSTVARAQHTANEYAIPIVGADVVVQGSQGGYSNMLRLPTHCTNCTATIVLDLEPSPYVDQERSTVEVAWAGAVLGVWPLKSVPAVLTTNQVPQSAAGIRLRFRTEPNALCTAGMQSEMRVTILQTSQVKLRYTSEQWSVDDWIRSCANRTVDFEPVDTHDIQALRAFWQAATWLERNHCHLPVRSDLQSRDADTLRQTISVQVLPSLSAGSVRIYTEGHRRLVLVGHTLSDVANVLMLGNRSDDRALMCHLDRCDFVAPPPTDRERVPPPVSVQPTVLTLDRAGYRDGWSFPLASETNYRLVWVMSDFVTGLLRTPELSLRYVIRGEAREHRTGILRIILNDRTLENYTLADLDDAGELRVRIPQNYWDERVWTFVVETVPEPRSGENCTTDNGVLLVDATSELVVPRRQRVASGLRAFRPGALSIGYDQGLSQDAWSAVFRLMRRHPTFPFWDIVDGEANIVLAPYATDESDVLYDLGGAQVHLRVPARRALHLSLEGESGRLNIQLHPRSSEEVDTPFLLDSSKVGWSGGQWLVGPIGLTDETEIRVQSDSDDVARRERIQQSDAAELRWIIDLSVVVMVLLMMGLTVRWVTRDRSKSTRRSA